MLVNDFRIAVGQNAPRGTVQELHLGFQFARQPDIICVTKCEQIAAGCFNAVIPGIRSSLVRVMHNNADAAIAGRHAADNLWRAVLGTVIYHNDFYVRIRLPKNGVQRTLHVFSVIETRYDNTYYEVCHLDG